MWQDSCFKLKLLFTCHNGVPGNSKDQDPGTRVVKAQYFCNDFKSFEHNLSTFVSVSMVNTDFHKYYLPRVHV